MGDQMPKEQYEFIEGIKHKMLDASNMKESEAWDFAFRVYQFDDFLRNYLNKDLIKELDFSIEATNMNDDYSVGLKNGIIFSRSLLVGEKPNYKPCSKKPRLLRFLNRLYYKKISKKEKLRSEKEDIKNEV